MIWDCVFKDVSNPYFAIEIATKPRFIKNCDFFGVDNKTNGHDGVLEDCHELDPQFADEAGLDFTRTGTNLDDKGFSEMGCISGVDYNVDIGPDQKAIPTPDFPDVGNVLDDDTVNGVPGTFVNVAEAVVKLGEQWGEDGTEFTGSYAPSAAQMPVTLEIADTTLESEIADTNVELEVVADA
jgi:hypothetical protein